MFIHFPRFGARHVALYAAVGTTNIATLRPNAVQNDGVSSATWLHDFDAKEKSREREARKHRRNLRLLLVRHGQSAMNVQRGIIGGRSDFAPLTKLGEEQAVALGRRLKGQYNFDKVFSSTAVRAHSTACIVMREMGINPECVIQRPEVLEKCQGEWTGKERRLIYNAAFVERVESETLFLRAPGVSLQDAPPGGPAPQGESFFDVECRMAAFIEGLLELELVDPNDIRIFDSAGDKTVVIFAHAHAIKSFVRRVAGASTEFPVHVGLSNTSITEFEYEMRDHNLGGWVIKRINDAAHLENIRGEANGE